MALIVFPDTVQVARTVLLATPEVVAIVGQRIVAKSLPDATKPWVRLTRVGGAPPLRQRLDRADIQVDCFNPPGSGAEIVAHQLARTCRAALFDAQGRTVGNPLAVITDVVDVNGIQDRPDESRVPPYPRWLFTVALFIRPIP